MTEIITKSNAIASLLTVPLLLILLNKSTVKCELVNQPPYFIPNSGDMARFSLSENTPVDSPVYQLRGKYLFLVLDDFVLFIYHFMIKNRNLDVLCRISF